MGNINPNSLGQRINHIIEETGTSACAAEILQKSKIQIFYDPDSYMSPTLTGFIYLPTSIQKDGMCYEIEFSLGPVDAIDCNMIPVHKVEEMITLTPLINVMDLPIIETDPLPGNEKRPRFDKQTQTCPTEHWF